MSKLSSNWWIRTLFTLFFFCTLFNSTTQAQQDCDCPYPILFLHGYINGVEAWDGTYDDPDFVQIWGGIADTFFAVLNATDQTRLSGNDGILGNNDDDVLFQFVNEDNVLNPGCIYGSDWQCFWNEDTNNPIVGKNPGDPIDECGDPGSLFNPDSDSNESAFFKQGYALGQMIDRVLAANPDKDKVILIGHSAGGCLSREYLQRTGVPTANGRWWVGNEHRVAKLVTVGTPHRGSNLFGNPFRPEPDGDTPPTPKGEESNEHYYKDNAPTPSKDQANPNFKDIVPDINSELVRDLRHSYLTSSLSCSFGTGPNQGPYLFGGDEGCIADGFHNDDVDCDGSTNDVIVGVNVDGTTVGLSDPSDGTYDNPNMPLPTDVRYTWITHDLVTGGDQVVDLSRQWIYNNNVPVPIDPGAPGGYYLTDTLLGNYTHTLEQEDVTNNVRGLDEPDYPKYAYKINPNNLYAGLPSYRSTQVNFTNQPNPDTDPDWYFVNVTGNTNDTLIVTPPSTMDGRVDVFTGNPGDFIDLNTTSPDGANFTATTTPIEIPLCNLNGGTTYYFRITHYNNTLNTWKTPYKYELRSAPACEIMSVNSGTRTDCSPNPSTYSQEIVVTYNNVPTNGFSIDVNGTTYPINSSPQTIVLNNLAADGQAVDVNVNIVNHDCCSKTFNNVFVAPGDADSDGFSDPCDMCPSYDDNLDANSNGIPDNCDDFSLQLNVVLEGAYETSTGLMRTDLNTLNLIPLNQPYNTSLYGYNGTESLTALPPQMVDWVLVDLRSNTNIASLLDRRAAVLMSNGDIKDVNGNDLTYSLPAGNDYYVVVRHRNHTDVMSSISINRTPVITYDFSTSTGMAYLGYQKNVGGTATMFAGEITQSSDIDNLDYDRWKEAPAILNVYDDRDTNMDGTVQTTDYDIWYPNRATNAPTEVGY